MAQYRLLEITYANGDRLWTVQKKILGLWWSEYFGNSTEWGSTYRSKEAAMEAYNYYAYPESRKTIKILAQNK